MQKTSSNRPSFWQKPTQVWLPLILGTLAVVSVITVIVLAVLFGIERNKTKTSPEPVQDNNDVCLTPYCIKAANSLLESIDESVNPCENFYEFTCGTWMKKNQIPSDASSYSPFYKLDSELNVAIIDLLSTPSTNDTKQINATSNARRLYNSCINETAIEIAGVDTILSLINRQLGGWPILQGSAWNDSTFNFMQLLLQLYQYRSLVIYNVRLQIYDKNSSIAGIGLGQSDLGLVDRSYYRNESVITVAYKNFIRNIARALNNDTSVDDNDVDTIFELEQNIAKYHWTPSDQNARRAETIYTTLSNLATSMNSTFNFVDYLTRLYALANVTLNDGDLVTVSEVEYLRNVSILVNQTSPRTLQNYVIWRFVMAQVDYMPKTFRAIKQAFDDVSIGTVSEPSRAKLCSGIVNGNMGFAVSKLYIEQYFDSNTRIQSLEMINNIRETLIDVINNSTWTDSQSKSKAIEKARAIVEKVGYPDYLGNDNVTKLEQDYAEYRFNSSYMENIIMMYQAQVKAYCRLLREPVDREAWSLFPPTAVEAFYIPWFNDITFPAGILQTPFFHKDAPKYLNYGGIGAIIGHEFTHGFDNWGREYDRDGNKIPWWTNETIQNFNQRKKCIIEQYANYTDPQANMKIQSEQTQGEDIADNGGLKEALFAYQKWRQAHPNVDKKLPGLSKYTAEQLFFINFGHIWCSKMTDQIAKNIILIDVHSPPRFRVTGSTSNFVEFDRAFGCKPGQGNSRMNKCSVW